LTNTYQWKKATLPVSSPSLGKDENGAHLKLAVNSGTAIYFHMVEVTR